MKRNATLSSEFTRPQHIVLRLCQFLLTLFVAAGMAQAQAPAAAAPQYVRASLETETINPAPGDIVTVAIVMDPKPGWHDYWVNPGDAGTPLELQWPHCARPCTTVGSDADTGLESCSAAWSVDTRPHVHI